MKKLLSEIKEFEPRREHGDISGLRESIKAIGLINPLTIDDYGKLLAGRRRYQALIELGWEEVEVNVMPIKSDGLKAFKIAIDENLKRKNLTDPEVAIAIKEYHDMKRKLEGSARRGERTDLTSLRCGEVCTQDKTSEDLGISRQAVGKAIKIATAIEEYPELANKTSGLGILAEQMAHVSYNSGESEWYTPLNYIKAAREVMGSIDLDPASSDKANEIIKASIYYTVYNDGRTKRWEGNVWLNPPYSQPLVSEFCNLLVEKYQNGEIQQACVLVNNATETAFFQNMLKVCQVVCFIKGRIRFLDSSGNGIGTPLQGQAILYFGSRKELFARLFSKFGVVLCSVRE